jgi:hypothetical protein
VSVKENCEYDSEEEEEEGEHELRNLSDELNEEHSTDGRDEEKLIFEEKNEISLSEEKGMETEISDE